jgi:hypothetical protein
MAEMRRKDGRVFATDHKPCGQAGRSHDRAQIDASPAGVVRVVSEKDERTVYGPGAVGEFDFLVGEDLGDVGLKVETQSRDEGRDVDDRIGGLAGTLAQIDPAIVLVLDRKRRNAGMREERARDREARQAADGD